MTDANGSPASGANAAIAAAQALCLVREWRTNRLFEKWSEPTT
eukprot:CAMPEP_0180425902 /NCGR_PEP_ID=MMETSP1036_2-20121128/5511_1 /TAXON_ID=632150 /ORGANISM="Azadinium spinosum, Strain 3D9" /LENGTH=42 /DNA_ID= /DNA_START= /DNA_END= /DNA_ORIENTATION=